MNNLLGTTFLYFVISYIALMLGGRLVQLLIARARRPWYIEVRWTGETKWESVYLIGLAAYSFRSERSQGQKPLRCKTRKARDHQLKVLRGLLGKRPTTVAVRARRGS